MVARSFRNLLDNASYESVSHFYSTGRPVDRWMRGEETTGSGVQFSGELGARTRARTGARPRACARGGIAWWA